MRISTYRARWTVAAGASFLVVLATVILTSASSQAPARGQSPRPSGTGTEQRAPAMAASDSCGKCHGALLKQPVVHAAAEDCTACHVAVKPGQHQFKAIEKSGELCTTCHEIQKATDKFVHGPVGVGDCVSCHDPHGTAAPKLVKLPGRQLCESCHEDMGTAIVAAKHVHAPVNDDCVSCHSPHASAYRYQLKAEGEALCVECHTNVADEVRKPIKHSAATAGRKCLGCHDPHVAAYPAQLRDTSMTLCLRCHDREIAAREGPPLLNIKAWLAAKPDHHGPIRDQDCSGCHRPHGGDRPRLLKADYPKKFYSPFDPQNYALCFDCHQPDLVRVERTTTLTGFRDGDRNLHFLHVNRPDKGRTCRACHEVHSSLNPKHLRESVPFGKWNLPINYEAKPDGGRCAPGCHTPQEYRRPLTLSGGKQSPGVP